jgi:hypothetical protein
MVRPSDPVFKDASLTAPDFQAGHDLATLKTYRYLRIGMLAAAATLGYAIVEEQQHAGVGCFLGSISGYYYTPVHSVFVGVMVAIGVMLVVVKGKTVLEDASLTLAGMMAPIVAFIPTSDDLQGVCRTSMLDAGRYEPARGSAVVTASISNNLHALLFAGYVAIALMLTAYFVQRRVRGSAPEFTLGTWISLAVGFAILVVGSVLLRWAYDWVLDGHARAACAMFLFLAVAALANSVFGFKYQQTSKAFAWIYGVVGVAMIVSGILFIVEHSHDRTSLGGHLVLVIEAVEIGLFVVFWSAQTVERWNQTV